MKIHRENTHGTNRTKGGFRVGQRRGRPNLKRNGGKISRMGKKGKRTGINIKVATINVRGLGEVGKKVLIEKWAEKHNVDVVCLTETHHPHSSTECARKGLYVEDERIWGDWIWYYSSGVSPAHLEAAEQFKKEGNKSGIIVRENKRTPWGRYFGPQAMVA